MSKTNKSGAFRSVKSVVVCIVLAGLAAFIVSRPESREYLILARNQLEILFAGHQQEIVRVPVSVPAPAPTPLEAEATPPADEGWRKQEAPKLNEKLDQAWEKMQQSETVLPPNIADQVKKKTDPDNANLSLSALAASVGRLPKFVILKEMMTLPARINGQIVGNAKVPPGTQLKPLLIQGEQLEVDYNGNQESVPAKSTDLQERLRAMPPISLRSPNSPITPSPPKIAWPVPVPVQELLATKPVSQFPKHDPSVHVVGKSFEVKSRLYGNPTINVLYRIPLKPDGTPGPYANNIIFYAPFAYQFFKDDKFDRFPAYTDEYGATLFTLEIKTDFENRDDPTTSYYYSESGSFDAVFEAQRILTEKYHLQPRKLLVIGKSGGANMAQRLGVERPDKVDALALFAPTRLADVSKPSGVKWMVEHTRNDLCTDEDKSFVTKLRALGTNPIYTTISPSWGHVARELFHHEPGDDQNVMLELFIPAMMELREKHQGIIPPEQEWPYLASKAEPQFVMENTPAYAQRIGKDDRLYFPSWAFCEHWTKLPPEPQEILIPKGLGGESVHVMARFPLVQPKGVIIFCQSWEAPDDENDAAAGDNLDYLAREGYVALSPNSGDLKAGVQDAQTVTRWAAGLFRQLPIFLAGYNLGGEIAFQTSCSNVGANVKGMAGISADFGDETVTSVSKPSIPFMLIYGETESTLDAVKVEKARSIAKACGQESNFTIVPGVGSTLEDKWYSGGLNKMLVFFQKQVAVP